ncbi:alpha/beta fold hydrolase [Thalassobacillus sp. C254]|uniref:alpha/beta fold hydrolase n=1 Tax=Thalassobacillus sp. C254 TaxID=1225341 RepID=UPI0009FA5303|nr:alpha/beta hydrolase [Thalassobacillus sp. C254]
MPGHKKNWKRTRGDNMSSAFIFLTGWAMNETIWEPLLPFLPKKVHIEYLSWFHLSSVEDIDQRVEETLQKFDSVTLIAWSLGSIAALEAASKKVGNIENMYLFSATPRFTKDSAANVSYGWSNRSVEKMRDSLTANADTVLESFHRKMFSRTDKEKHSLDSFFKQQTQRNKPLTDLKMGLDYLLEKDVREKLHCIHVPVHIIHGKYDRIIPIEAGINLAGHLPDGTFHELECGHLPFFSLPETSAKIITCTSEVVS